MDSSHNMTSHGTSHDLSQQSEHWPMVFHTGTNEFILLQSLRSTTDAHMGLACVVVFLMACSLDGLKLAKKLLARRMRGSGVKAADKANAGDEVSFARLLCAHVIQTALHTVNVIISYLLMLLAMTFNVWIFIAIVAGSSTGYFLFSWKKSFRVRRTSTSDN